MNQTPNQPDLVISRGTVVTPGGVFRSDVGIRGSQIAALGVDLTAARTIDATGCYVIPGGVDVHVHLQMQLGGRVSTDDFSAGTVAAAHGGTTTVIDFVDPQPGESLLDALARRRAEADDRVAVDYGLHMTLPAWHMAHPPALAQLPEVVAAGCATFKLYMAYPHVMLDDVTLFRALRAIAEAGGRAVVHAETGPLLDELCQQALAAGQTAPIHHARTRPAALEASAVQRAIVLADLAGCPLHVFHVGAEAVVETLRTAPRSSGGRKVSVGAETCPQYLLLTAEEHLGGPDGELYVCAPPLREAGDQAALWAGLADGALSMVSTDHCPWTRAEKQQPDFTQVPGGLPSIEARLALLYHHGVAAGRISLERWAAVCCANPARWMGLNQKGRLAPGYDADIVIFDPQRSVTLSADSLHETAGWTPYAGMTVQGWPRTVLLRGEIVVRDETFCGQYKGRFTARSFDAGSA
jgi:dihydropyrimidinase